MNSVTSLIVIDQDSRQRAQISHSLSSYGIHAEPFESVSELTKNWTPVDSILIHDQGSAISDLIGGMARHGEWRPIIAYDTETSSDQIVRAILDGAIDYMTWPFSVEEIDHSIEQAKTRTHGLSNARTREAIARGRIEKLTRRERQVLDSVADGYSNRQIGEKLTISPRTVEIHRANMLNKLGADNTSQAIRIAIEAELVH